MKTPTVTLQKDGQRKVVNENDYHYPDGTIRERFRGWKVVIHNTLSAYDIRSNEEELAAELAKRAEAQAASRVAKEAELKKLVDQVPTSGPELAAFIEALPNKGAVIAHGIQHGLDLDGTLTRAELNSAATAALEAQAATEGNLPEDLAFAEATADPDDLADEESDPGFEGGES